MVLLKKKSVKNLLKEVSAYAYKLKMKFYPEIAFISHNLWTSIFTTIVVLNCECNVTVFIDGREKKKEKSQDFHFST